MKTNDAINFFGNKTKVAMAAGVTQSAVSRWVTSGYIPKGSAAILSAASKGKLIFNKDFYQRLKEASECKRINKRKASAD
ncbi:Cro/CI family transcriptional regulator [Klebsiella pneumoniae]|nr:Cro/CI family transcriptional regulator [Klebsiella pneumoniae]